LAAEIFISHVAGDKNAICALCLYQTLRLLGIAMFVEVDHSYGSLFFGEGNSDSAANAAVSAGNEGNFTFQFTGAAVSCFIKLRPRLHFAFSAWLLPLFLL
jgi:hypothetical protein